MRPVALSKSEALATRPGLLVGYQRFGAGFATAASSSGSSLPWAEFFRMRNERKLVERVGAVTGGVVGFVYGSFYFG